MNNYEWEWGVLDGKEHTDFDLAYNTTKEYPCGKYRVKLTVDKVNTALKMRDTTHVQHLVPYIFDALDKAGHKRLFAHIANPTERDKLIDQYYNGKWELKKDDKR